MAESESDPLRSAAAHVFALRFIGQAAVLAMRANGFDPL